MVKKKKTNFVCFLFSFFKKKNYEDFYILSGNQQSHFLMKEMNRLDTRLSMFTKWIDRNNHRYNHKNIFFSQYVFTEIFFINIHVNKTKIIVVIFYVLLCWRTRDLKFCIKCAIEFLKIYFFCLVMRKCCWEYCVLSCFPGSPLPCSNSLLFAARININCRERVKIIQCIISYQKLKGKYSCIHNFHMKCLININIREMLYNIKVFDQSFCYKLGQ